LAGKDLLKQDICFFVMSYREHGERLDLRTRRTAFRTKLNWTKFISHIFSWR